MDFIDYYAVLGVSKHATSEEIDRAYRQLARKFHPDVSKAKDAEEQFKRVNEAYEVLKDPTKRQHYDRYGTAWKEAQRQGTPPPGAERFRVEPGGSGGFEFEFGDAGDFSDFFQELFGFGGLGGMHKRTGLHGGAPRRAAAGADQEAQLVLSLEEAARGGKREITLRDPLRGRSRTLAVTIPAGVRPGQRIRLAGQGDPGRGGAPAGHLYLQVEVGPHPLFRLDGADLYTVLTVTPPTAVLGGQARLQTLDGAVKLKIPAGSSSGQRIRLAGKGFPNGHGRAGDLYVEIRIVVPTKPSAEQRELYEALGRLDANLAPGQHASAP